MTPFERHNIKRLSPSALLTFQHDPALWMLKWCMHKWGNDEPLARTAWGTAVEAGLGAFLHGHDPFVHGLKTFDRIMTGNWRKKDYDAGVNDNTVIDVSLSDEALEYREMIAPCLEHLIAGAARHFNSKPLMQLWTEYQYGDIAVPMSGQLDFLFTTNIIWELKTTSRIPSKPNPDHLSQLALYCLARNCHGVLIYVSPERLQLYRLPKKDAHTAAAALFRAANAINNLLKFTSSAKELASLLTPDFSDFRWTDELKTEALKIWN